MTRRRTIEEMEKKHPDLVKGQQWRGNGLKYKYNCEKHGIYLQDFSNHQQGQGCPKCALEKRRTAGGLSDTPEYNSVGGHYRFIFNRKMPQHKNYKGMPFFDGWNLKKGGSYGAGAQWIIENIGKRPEGCSLHIVEHEKGFVPNNLIWASPKKQNAEQMFKIIAELKCRIKELERQIAQEKA